MDPLSFSRKRQAPKAVLVCLLLLYISFVYPFCFIIAQDFKIIKINTSQYPEIRAVFLATDLKGNKILNAQPGDFKITENKSEAEIIEVGNPNQVPIPVSVVLVFDNSISMAGSRLKMALKAGKYFIEQMPLETSEVAIASFSDKVYVNCDFTQDQERLFASLDNIKTVGGTNYTEAFLNDVSGALAITQNGRYKKYIIFLTDGLSNTEASKIIAIAKKQNVTVFCVTVELAAPPVLKEISAQTGGAYFQTNANSSQLEAIYAAIFQSLEVRKYGNITWKAPLDCQKQKEVQLVFRNTPVKFTYTIPDGKVGQLEADPTLMMFGAIRAGIEKSLSVDLIARNIPVSITRLTLAPKSPFFVADSIAFPLTLAPGHIKNLTLTFKSNSNKLITDKLTVSSRECGDQQVTLIGGSEEELKLVCPKGGETLTVGMDTSIRWEGIKKGRTLAMYYRTGPKKDWQLINEAAGLYYKWTAPQDTGHRFQVRIKTVPGPNGKLYLASTIPNQRDGLRSVCFNDKGDKIVTSDKKGMIKIWDTYSGRPVKTINAFAPGGPTLLTNDDKYLVSFSREEIATWSMETSEVINQQFTRNKLIFSHVFLPDGSERLISCNVLKDNANALRLWMPELNLNAVIFEKEAIKSACLSIDGSKAIIFTNEGNIKIWDIHAGKSITCKYQPINPQTIIISPNAKTALVVTLGIFTAIDLTNGAELFRLRSQHVSAYYSKSGDMLVLKSASNDFTFSDSYSGRTLYQLNKVNYYHTFSQGHQLLYQRNDSITLIDAKQKRKIFQTFVPGIVDVIISPDETKVMTVLQSNVIEFYDLRTGKRINRIGEIDNTIRTALFSPDGKGIIVVMKNNAIQYWSPDGYDKSKEVTSGYFSVISPKPLVCKEVSFGEQYLDTPGEMVVQNFITNPTSYPVKITGMELRTQGSPNFSIVSDTDILLLYPKSRKAVEFRFVPSSLGAKEAWVRTCTLADTFLTRLTGTGIEKQFEVSSSPVSFGKVKVGQFKDTLAAVIRNSGKKPLVIKAIRNDGPDKTQFRFTGGKTYTLLPGDSLRVNIRFGPAFRGKTSGSLLVSIDGVNAPQVIQLYGDGIAARTVWVVGTTLNASDNLPLTAEVRLIDLSSNTILSKIRSGTKGDFKFQVNADRNYGIVADKPGYLSTSENIDIRSATLTDTICRNIFLTPIQAGAMIRMNCIFFEFAKANLLDASKNELNRIADFLALHKSIAIELHGHTDSIGTDANNMVLSKQRADAVQNYLVKQGIAAQRLSVKAFGETKPVSVNATEEGRQLNRRVEAKINSL